MFIALALMVTILKVSQSQDKMQDTALLVLMVLGSPDDFGLEYGGYPGVRSPISLDSVEQVTVSVVDFDVRDSGSTAGNINVVTKSGTNEFAGSVYGFQMGDSWVGDKIEDQDVTIGEFDEETVGFTFGGPVIKDKLFFFVNYDEFTKTEPGIWGAAGFRCP